MKQWRNSPEVVSFVANMKERRTALYLQPICQVTEFLRIRHLHILALTLQDRCTLKLRILKTRSRNHRSSMFACSCVRPLKLYIWNLHKPLVLNRSYLPSEDTSRRGLPATITSDDAKTFRSSSQDICKIARAEDVWQYLANKQISWNFIIEEGLVVGRILGMTCQKHQETFEEDPRKIYSQFWQTMHCFSGNRRHHQFQTPHVRVRWQQINIILIL